jgi:endogenous inhibitor of DNA gyrase (YacG/DUF329 family)
MTDQDNTARIYPCPQCRKPVQWRADNPWRPFCSERCKMIDLGDWASEKHSIPGESEEEGPDFPDT